MLINDIFNLKFRPVLNTEDDIIRLESCLANLENNNKIKEGYQISANITCRIAFDIYKKNDNYNHCGKVFVESIDADKYMNIFLNLYEFDSTVAKSVISIIEQFKSKLMYISTDPKDKEYHKILEELGYSYQKDYIYPDIKLYFKEME